MWQRNALYKISELILQHILSDAKHHFPSKEMDRYQDNSKIWRIH